MGGLTTSSYWQYESSSSNSYDDCRLLSLSSEKTFLRSNLQETSPQFSQRVELLQDKDSGDSLIRFLGRDINNSNSMRTPLRRTTGRFMSNKMVLELRADLKMKRKLRRNARNVGGYNNTTKPTVLSPTCRRHSENSGLSTNMVPSYLSKVGSRVSGTSPLANEYDFPLPIVGSSKSSSNMVSSSSTISDVTAKNMLPSKSSSYCEKSSILKNRPAKTLLKLCDRGPQTKSCSEPISFELSDDLQLGGERPPYARRFVTNQTDVTTLTAKNTLKDAEHSSDFERKESIPDYCDYVTPTFPYVYHQPSQDGPYPVPSTPKKRKFSSPIRSSAFDFTSLSRLLGPYDGEDSSTPKNQVRRVLKFDD